MNTGRLLLKYKYFTENTLTFYQILRNGQDFADITLACKDGVQVKAHTVILAACSPVFTNILQSHKHPRLLVFRRGLSYDTMYSGEWCTFWFTPPLLILLLLLLFLVFFFLFICYVMFSFYFSHWSLFPPLGLTPPHCRIPPPLEWAKILHIVHIRAIKNFLASTVKLACRTVRLFGLASVGILFRPGLRSRPGFLTSPGILGGSWVLMRPGVRTATTDPVPTGPWFLNTDPGMEVTTITFG